MLIAFYFWVKGLVAKELPDLLHTMTVKDLEDNLYLFFGNDYYYENALEKIPAAHLHPIEELT